MFRDADIFLITGIARYAGRGFVGQPAMSILDKWFFGYDEFPSGAIDLKLDTVISSEAISMSFIALLDAATQMIASHGTNVAGVWLTKVLDDDHGATYNDVKTSDILKKIDRFRKLIS